MKPYIFAQIILCAVIVGLAVYGLQNFSPIPRRVIMSGAIVCQLALGALLVVKMRRNAN